MLQTGLNRQLLRFGLSGLMVTALHALVATAFINIVLPVPAIANGVAFVVATMVSYLINTLWSFSSPLHGRNLTRFICVSVLGCLLAIAVSGGADRYGLHYGIGIALVACAVPPVTFLLHRSWTYR